jgi:hypothetical protein
MEEVKNYIKCLAEAFRIIDNGDSGNDAAWHVAANALGMDTNNTSQICRIPTKFLYEDNLSYAVFKAEHNDQEPCVSDVYNTAGDWVQFVQFLGRHPELGTIYPLGRTELVAEGILRAFVASVIGPVVEIPLELL